MNALNAINIVKHVLEKLTINVILVQENINYKEQNALIYVNQVIIQILILQINVINVTITVMNASINLKNVKVAFSKYLLTTNLHFYKGGNILIHLTKLVEIHVLFNTIKKIITIHVQSVHLIVILLFDSIKILLIHR